MITLHTDGSSYEKSTENVSRPSGWAWQRNDGWYEAGSRLHATSGEMELTAIIQALTLHIGLPNVKLRTDYQSFVHSWRRGVVSEQTGPLMLEALRISSLIPNLKVEFVRGHSGDPLGNWADYRASVMSRKAATEGLELTMTGYVPPKLFQAKRLERHRKTTEDDRRMRAYFGVALPNLAEVTDVSFHDLVDDFVKHDLIALDTCKPTPKALRRLYAKQPDPPKVMPNGTVTKSVQAAEWDIERVLQLVYPDMFHDNS